MTESGGVVFRKWQCRIIISAVSVQIACRISEIAMSHLIMFLEILLGLRTLPVPLLILRGGGGATCPGVRTG